MSCRACLLLEKDLRELERNPLPGVSAHIVESEPFVCCATLSGLKSTKIEKDVFHLRLKFTEHYNEDYPEIFFNTVLFHPNIDSKTGKLSIDFKKHLPTNVEITLKNILIFTQNILAYPITENTVNIDASNLSKNDSSSYKKTAEHCAKDTQIIFDKLSESVFGSEKVEPSTTCPLKQVKEISQFSRIDPKQVSFDYYYKSWKNIATTSSKSQYTIEENQPSKVTFIPSAENCSHYAHQPTKRTLKPPSQNASKDRNRVALMKKIYLNHLEEVEKTPVDSPKDVYFPPSIAPKHSEMDLIDDSNVEELIHWTKQLNEGQFDFNF